MAERCRERALKNNPPGRSVRASRPRGRGADLPCRGDDRPAPRPWPRAGLVVWLLGATLCAASGCGPGTPPLDPAEQAAVDAIRDLGGAVTVGTIEGRPTVVAVDLRRTETGDDDLACLRDLPNVVQLRAARTNVGDQGLEHVAALTKLQELYLGRTQVTDQGLAALKGLTDLKWIAISNTAVTAEGLQKLQKDLPQLKPVR